ncbi:hypothetical protein [Novosphingobium sp. AAP83]|uniref:hypothetical protein n=1 Tax=Novosphingobium sp. AAP83 TaxID=1523425 RepID=UPI0018D039A2
MSLLISQNSDVISLGEICNFQKDIFEKSRCSCGSLYHQCDFWGDYCQDKSISDPICYAARRSEASYLVDSSKTAYWNALRPFMLRRSGWNVFVIHMRRDLPSVIRSAKKGRNTHLENGVIRKRLFESLRTCFGRLIADLAAIIWKLFGFGPYLAVNYQNLREDFDYSVNAIGKFLNVDLSIAREKVLKRQALDVGHEVSGNRLLRAGPVYFWI